MTKYEKVTKKFEPFFDQDFLKRIIDGKLDSAKLDEIQNQFAHAGDFRLLKD
jgi:hypothetical protein